MIPTSVVEADSGEETEGQMALSGEDPHDRMAAVVALTRVARTPSAQAALIEVAQQSKVKQSAGKNVAGLQGRVQQ